MGSSGPKDSGKVTRARLSARRRAQAATTKPQGKAAGGKAAGGKAELTCEREPVNPEAGKRLLDLAKHLGFTFTSTDPTFEKRVPGKQGFVDQVVGLWQWHTSGKLREHFPAAHKHSGRIYAGQAEAARRALEYYGLLLDEATEARR